MYIIGMDMQTDNTQPPASPAAPDAPPSLYASFPRAFGFEFAVVVFFFPPFVVLWGFLACYYYISGGVVSLPILKAATYYSAALSLAMLLYGNARAARRLGGVAVDGERIVKKGFFGVAEIRCGEAVGVRCTNNPLFSRRMVLKTAKGGLSVPLNVRGGHRMVEAVFEKLSARGVFRGSEEKAAAVERRLRGWAVRYGSLYRLRGKYMPNFVKAAVASAVFNGAAAAVYWERGLVVAIGWGLVGMLFQALAYLAAEKVWMLKRLVGREALVGAAAGVDIDEADADGIDGSFSAIHAASALAALLAGMAVGVALPLPS